MLTDEERKNKKYQSIVEWIYVYGYITVHCKRFTPFSEIAAQWPME